MSAGSLTASFVLERNMHRWKCVDRTRYKGCGAAVQDHFVKPKMDWISTQRDKRSDLLVLPAVGVDAAEALGRTRAMEYISSLHHLQPAASFNKPERYSPLQFACVQTFLQHSY